MKARLGLLLLVAIARALRWRDGNVIDDAFIALRDARNVAPGEELSGHGNVLGSGRLVFRRRS